MSKQKKDPMLVGYQFSYAQDKNPYDFLTDETTGRRPTQTTPPSGQIMHNLSFGIGAATLPPLEIWKQGEWLNTMADDVMDFKSHVLPAQNLWFDTWVTPGEGTPGNYKWRLYTLPSETAQHGLDVQLRPKHPYMWAKKLKEGNTTFSYSGGSGTTTGQGWQTWKQTPESKLPAGTRIRCTQCGHWFRVDDLKGHVDCCPQVNQFSDWAIACECCASMDDTATVKAGFPRPMYTGTKDEPTPATDLLAVAGGVNDNGAGGEPAERPSGDTADAAGSGAAV